VSLINLQPRPTLALQEGGSVAERAGVPVSRVLVRRAREVAEAIFGTEHGAPPAERLDWLEAELQHFLGHAGAWARLVARVSFFATCVLGPLWLGKLRGLGTLPLAERQQVLHALERTPVALAALGARAMLCILYYEHPDAAREIHFDGRCLSGRARS
jgi:hypothetical protein